MKDFAVADDRRSSAATPQSQLNSACKKTLLRQPNPTMQATIEISITHLSCVFKASLTKK